MAARVSLLDLTAEQAAEIEDQVGAPMDDWGQVSRGRLLPLILHALKGGDLASYQAMTMRELVAAVQLREDQEGN